MWSTKQYGGFSSPRFGHHSILHCEGESKALVYHQRLCYSPWPAGVDMGVDVLVIVITGVQAGLLFVAGQVGGVVIDTQKVVGT